MIKDSQESSNKFKKQKNSLKIFLGVSLVIFLLVFISVINILLKDKKENDAIMDLVRKSQKIEQQNNELKKIIQDYQTQTNKEKVARENLNMMLEGENVVVVNDTKKEVQINLRKSEKKITTNMTNYRKWLMFFFYKDNSNTDGK